MEILKQSILQKLEKEDLEKIEYFIKILLKQSKYNALRQEIEARRKEITNGNFLTDDEIWNELNV